MKDEPLFIKFLNGQVMALDVIETVKNTSQDEISINIAEEQLKSSYDLSIFKKDFKSAVEDLIDNGITQRLINYLDSYMKPSLEEFLENNTGNRSGEKRYIHIKASDAPWVEAVLCYNLCIFIRVFGIDTLKKCPVCGKFFSHKGKYAKYCSDACKISKV